MMKCRSAMKKNEILTSMHLEDIMLSGKKKKQRQKNDHCESHSREVPGGGRRCGRAAAGGGGGAAGGLLLDGSTGSTWRLEKVLETDGGDGGPTPRIRSMPPNCAPKSDQNGSFMLCVVHNFLEKESVLSHFPHAFEQRSRAPAESLRLLLAPHHSLRRTPCRRDVA